MMLEFSQYLEAYLWPNYDPETAGKAYQLSIIVMVNEKFRERTEAWQCFTKKPENFGKFFMSVLKLALDEGKETSAAEQCAILTFLVNSFGSVETRIVHEQMKKLTSIEIWDGLLETQRADLFKKQKKLKKIWENVVKKMEKEDAEDGGKAKFERTFLWKLIEKFKKVLKSIDEIEEGES